MEAKDRLIFALDVASLDEARRYLEMLSGEVGWFKVGLELFVAAGPEAARLVAGRGRLFLDLKLHDIPATVRRAAQAAASLGAAMLTVHAEGERLLSAAVEGAGGAKVLAVTLLTSTSAEEAASLFRLEAAELVVERARMAERSGCAGVVCSPQEAARVKAACPQLLVVTPGIRPSWAAEPGDQRRVASPAEALRSGADYLVVGRPISRHPNPREAARRVVEEIASAAA